MPRRILAAVAALAGLLVVAPAARAWQEVRLLDRPKREATSPRDPLEGQGVEAIARMGAKAHGLVAAGP